MKLGMSIRMKMRVRGEDGAKHEGECLGDCLTFLLTHKFILTIILTLALIPQDRES